MAIAAAIPRRSRRAHPSEFLDAVRERAELDCRSDGARTLIALSRLLVTYCDRSYTTLVSWDTLASLLITNRGRPANRRTIAKCLALLRSWGCLATVATGRSGRFAPKGSQSTSYDPTIETENVDGDPSNEVAVYVLTVPLTSSEVVAREVEEAREKVQEADVHRSAGDEKGTPPSERDWYSPARASGTSPEVPIEPLRGPDRWKAAQARRRDPVLRHRPQHWFPTGETPGGKDAALRAAHELRVRLSILRCLSSEHVRSVLRPFFWAGYTLGDVLMAIDLRPDGTRWPHDGADSVDNPAAWLAHRLRAWTVDGVPRRSVSQREAHRRADDRARHRAAAERTAQTIPASDAAKDRILAPLRAAGILRPARATP